MKRIISLLLSFALIIGVSLWSVPAAEPLVPRKFALDMNASLGTYKGAEYIVLDISIVDITDPYGIVSIEFDIEFDGTKLTPLWQTAVQLNGDGEQVADGSITPQMIVSWPKMQKTTYIPGHGLHTYEVDAVIGLCKEYAVSGNGKLNVDFLMMDNCDAVVKEDGEMAFRLYFTPNDGFDNGATYTFKVDGKYDVPYSNQSDIGVAATSGLLNEPGYKDRLSELRVYGYGDEASVTVRDEVEEPDINSESSEESSEEESSDPSLHRPSVAGKGDVNGDGIADNLDAAYVLRYDAFMTDFTDEQLKNGDVNSDGTVNSVDAAQILKYDAGLIGSFN